ncbi:MAG: Uma2 family endonuclease [Verrucomicrobiaceae bacterium]|nr:Uma2 family endonuclease [Verrucomicrobiaceae bacterium]
MSTAVLERPLSYEEERGKPMPSHNHGLVQMRLGVELSKEKKREVFSELTLSILGTNYTPDLSVYPRRPVDFRHDTIRMTELPLMAVEIFSPSQGTQEVMNKVNVYLENGIKSCWVVTPPLKNITIYLPDGKQVSASEGIIADPATGISADLGEVFE